MTSSSTSASAPTASPSATTSAPRPSTSPTTSAPPTPAPPSPPGAAPSSPRSACRGSSHERRPAPADRRRPCGPRARGGQRGPRSGPRPGGGGPELPAPPAPQRAGAGPGGRTVPPERRGLQRPGLPPHRLELRLLGRAGPVGRGPVDHRGRDGVPVHPRDLRHHGDRGDQPGRDGRGEPDGGPLTGHPPKTRPTSNRAPTPSFPRLGGGPRSLTRPPAILYLSNASPSPWAGRTGGTGRRSGPPCGTS